jgi:cytochrome c oxidase subunit II
MAVLLLRQMAAPRQQSRRRSLRRPRQASERSLQVRFRVSEQITSRALDQRAATCFDCDRDRLHPHLAGATRDRTFRGCSFSAERLSAAAGDEPRRYANMTSIKFLLAAFQPSDPLKFPESPNFWMPTESSTTARDIDWLYDVMVWISAISLLAIAAAVIYFIVKYRAPGRKQNEQAKSQVSHNTTLEITWAGIPLVILVALFVWGFKGYIDLRTSPKDALDIHVTAQKWNWTFSYPNGHTDDTLNVPIDTNVRLIITSVDVIHSVWIPSFRVKMDAVPGRYTELWFKAIHADTFPLECTEYCGTAHSDMLSRVVVHPPGGYEAWLEQKEEEMLSKPLPELGEITYKKQGCGTCHSTDGSEKIGPTLKGRFGQDRRLQDGSTVKIDENYIKQSLLDPQSQIAEGYPPSMPTFKGRMKDREITGLIEYIKGLK